MYGWLFFLAGAIIALLGGLFGFWGVVVALAIFATAITTYTESVLGFHAQIVLNAWTQKQRVLFQGLNFVLPWENSSINAIDLRVELHDVREETYPSEDAMMDVRYVYTIRPNFSEDSVITYASYEKDAIKMEGRALFSMLLSDYYRTRSSDDLKDKNKINLEVFGSGDGKQVIEEFQGHHGVVVVVILEDSDFSAETQKARDIVAKAKSIGEARKKLVDEGYSKEEAEKIVKMLNLPESVRENIINVQAKIEGLENLEHLSAIVGSGGVGGEKKGGKK